VKGQISKLNEVQLQKITIIDKRVVINLHTRRRSRAYVTFGKCFSVCEPVSVYMDKTVCHHVLHFTEQFSQSTVVTIKQYYLENSGKQADGLFGIVQ